jgi:hypothetical protein
LKGTSKTFLVVIKLSIGDTPPEGKKIIPILMKFSVAKIWDDAKLEWDLDNVEMSDGMKCACGHDITEVCKIHNNKNNAPLIVGNCCVNHILPSTEHVDRIFYAIREQTINAEIIKYAYQRKIILEWERNFLMSILHDKKLTPEQQSLKNALRVKIEKHINK